MRENIHPATQQIKAICSCGNELLVDSTLENNLQLDICSSCHPFYTGKQKMVDTAGRIKTFENRYYRRKGKQAPEADGANDAE